MSMYKCISDIAHFACVRNFSSTEYFDVTVGSGQLSKCATYGNLIESARQVCINHIKMLGRITQHND